MEALKKATVRAGKHIANIVGLQTPVARLSVFFGISLMLYFVSYKTLLDTPSISIYSNLGIPSPSIGLTRAYWLLIHGDFTGAWQMNKLIYLVAFVLAGLVVADGVLLLKKHRNKVSGLNLAVSSNGRCI